MFRASYALDGNKAILSSLANVAGTPGAGESVARGNMYLAVRNESGAWQISSLNASSTEFIGQVPLAAEAEHGATLWEQHTPSQAIYRVDLYRRRSPTSGFELIGPLSLPQEGLEQPSSAMDLSEKRYDRPVAATSDYGHVLVFALSSEDYWKEINGQPYDQTQSNLGSLYEYSGINNSHPTLVGVEGPKGSTTLVGLCGTELGGPHAAYNALSGDGETIFFTVRPGCETPASNEIYARVHGSLSSNDAAETVHVSEDHCTTACSAKDSGKNFEGASEDGKRVFFTSTQKLTNNAIDGTTSGDASLGAGCAVITSGSGGCNLYETDIEPNGNSLAAGLRLIAGGEVLGVVGMAENGSYVYFASREEIAEAGLNEFNRGPQGGLPNLYAYNTHSSQIRFIATVRASDRADWTSSFRLRAAEVSGEDGRFLLFMGSGSGITPDDTAEVLQLYEYDAVTGELVRLTKGEDGFNGDGNGVGEVNAIEPEALFGVAGQLGGRSDFKSAVNVLNMTKDGRTVAFEMRGQLSPRALSAAQGCQSLYEFRTANRLSEGSVHLVSDGRDTQLYKGEICGPQFQGVDADGANILFTTADPLLPSDVDGLQRDIYDARIDGGFASVPGGEAGDCSTSTCEGPSSNTFGLPGIPTSFGQPGEALLPTPVESIKPKKKARRGSRKRGPTLRACRKELRGKRAACERAARRRSGLNAKATTKSGRR